MNIKEKLTDQLKAYQAYDDTESKGIQDFLDYLDREGDVFGKINPRGHVTASAWIISPELDRALLVHHRSLDLWLQMGGHTEEGEDLITGAKREVEEESGLSEVNLLMEDIFDVDVHFIPANDKTPGHYHYDVRYVFQADPEETLIISEESKALEWVDLDQVMTYNPSPSVTRMVVKTQALTVSKHM